MPFGHRNGIPETSEETTPLSMHAPTDTFRFVTREACPVCLAARRRTLIDLALHEPPLSGYLEAFYSGRISPRRLTGARYLLQECLDCGLLYQRDIPDADFLSEIYDPSGNTDYTRARPSRDRQRYASQVESFLAHLHLPSRDVHVLDYGAGGGDWLAAAAERGCRTFAAEMSFEMSRRLTACGHEVVDPEALPPDTFHFINADQVFEHLAAPGAVASRLAGALRPGGILRVSVPNGKPVKARLKAPDWTAPKGSPRSLNAVAPLEHINCFGFVSLLTLGRLAGVRPLTSRLRRPWSGSGRPSLMDSIRHRLRTPRGLKAHFVRP